MLSTLAKTLIQQLPQVLTLSAACALAACDSQVSPAYTGEALLTMEGSVHLVNNSTEGALQPALAFVDQKRGEIHIMDVEAKGEFPASFTMHVYEPPSEQTLAAVSADAPEPKIAVGYVTAVTAAHPELIQFASDTEVTISASGNTPRVTKVCTHDGKSCYTETVTCPQPDSPPSECTVTHTGDSKLGDDPWKSFAGLSQNYVVVYLTGALAAGTPATAALGTLDALDQGYNVLALRPLTQAELNTQAECAAAAEPVALARFNAKHGTSYDAQRVIGLSCNPTCPGPDPQCTPPTPEQCPPAASEAEIEAYYQLLTEVKAARKCLDSSVRATRVADSAHTQITVTIAPGLDPWGQGRTDESSVQAPNGAPPAQSDADAGI